MKLEPLRTSDYLGHIVEAIERIFRYIDDLDEVAFLRNEMVQDAAVRNIEVIGEACRNIQRHDPAFATAYPDFPLKPAYEMRNALSHGYFRIEMGLVWKTIHEELPQLHAMASSLIGNGR